MALELLRGDCLPAQDTSSDFAELQTASHTWLSFLVLHTSIVLFFTDVVLQLVDSLEIAQVSGI